jgi:beta-glucanase (GH16 family)
MSEDELGRQVSELIRASADVELPPSLVASVADIPELVRRRHDRRKPLVTTAAICTGVVLAAAALIGPRFWSNPPVAASPTGPILATKVQVLTVDELRAAIATERAGGLQPQDVVADVSIDASRKTAPLSRECDPVGACQVIGTLHGFDDADGAVAIRQEDRVLPPASDTAALQAPVALRLTGRGPVEFLGHVRSAPSGSPTWSVAQALADTATAADEQVVGVNGWLGGGIEPSCGPAPQGTVPPQPFDCQIRDYLTPDSRRLVTAVGSNGYSYAAPRDGLPVQEGAYETYAPNPSYSDANKDARQATYLLRMVAYEAPDCVNCRSWLVVGRLDASAMESSTEAGPIVRSAAELERLVSSDRSQWVGKAVYVDGVVTPETRGNGGGCGTSSLCQIGTLESTSEKVFASPYTVSMLPSEADFMTSGVLALKVRQDGLEYVGYAGYNTDNSFYFTPAQLADPQELNHAPLLIVVAKGWLVDGGLHSCASATGSQDLSDTPFEACPEAWLATNADQPVSSTDAGGSTITAPSEAVRVQPEAYAEFAPNPSLEPTGVAHVPRFGTFLLRLVQNPQTGSNNQSGWQVVARLDP